MTGSTAKACLADKGYDSDVFLAWLKEHDIKAVIPPKANRKIAGFGKECDPDSALQLTDEVV